MRARLPWLALLALLAGAFALRWSLREVPLERDEGEYAYFGQLILQGIPPWERAYNMKLPGIYLAYAGVLALFGESASGIHTGLALAALASAAFLFLLMRRLFDPWSAVFGAGFLLLLEIGHPVQGLFANAEHFLLPWALLGSWLLVRGVDEDSWRDRTLGSVALGLAFLTKQHGVFFVLAAGLFVLASAWSKPKRGKTMLVEGGAHAGLAALPYLLACLWLAASGVFERFWFWTFTYARAYTGQATWESAWPALQERMTGFFDTAPLLWILAGFGLAALVAWKPARKRLGFTLPFTLLSVAAVMPGLLFRPHYFVLLLPAAALLAGIGLRFVAIGLARIPMKGLAAVAGTLLFAGSIGQSLHAQADYLFRLTPHQIARAMYGPNPFPESEAIAEWIRNDTTEDDTIAILGSEPQIYFHAGRLSATGYVYSYAPMETHEYAASMQQEMIREIQGRDPKYVVWVNYVLSWLPRPESETLLLSWARRFLGDYEVVARVEITPYQSRFLKAGELGRPPGPPSLDFDPGRCVIDLYRKKAPARSER